MALLRVQLTTLFPRRATEEMRRGTQNEEDKGVSTGRDLFLNEPQVPRWLLLRALTPQYVGARTITAAAIAARSHDSPVASATDIPGPYLLR